MKKILTLAFVVGSLFACNNAANEEAKMKEEQRKSDSIVNAKKEEEKAKEIDATNLKFVQDTDPVCDMSIKDGVTDTAMINGKLYGFCSHDCKESYVKDNSANKQMK